MCACARVGITTAVQWDASAAGAAVLCTNWWCTCHKHCSHTTRPHLSGRQRWLSVWTCVSGLCEMDGAMAVCWLVSSVRLSHWLWLCIHCSVSCYFSLGSMQSIAVSLSVCLSVSFHMSQKHLSSLHDIFFTCYQWPCLGPRLMTV